MAAGEAARTKDWDAWEKFHAEDITAWAPTYEVAGRAALLEEGKKQNAPLGDDIRQEAVLVAETDDTVVLEYTWSMPHPSGIGRATLKGLMYSVFRDDLIVKVVQYWDSVAFMAQLEADTGNT